MDNYKQELLKALPSVSDLMASPRAAEWQAAYPRTLVVNCIRDTVENLRKAILNDSGGRCGTAHVTGQYVLDQAGSLIGERTRPHLRSAINATGVLMHTGLGRAVLPATVVDSMLPDLNGYVTLAVDRPSGDRSERDYRVEYILTELTGAEAATVANNNAAATMLVLCALADRREVIVSRGQLIEIGGAFRLPDVMLQSGSEMREVGTTNRTHLKDYISAITDKTAAILRVHPSNYRIVGFTSQPELAELAEAAHSRGLVLIDDLGAGALVGLERFGLPHEPTVAESVSAGADIVLFSGDKLIGGPQAGIIVGKKALIDKIRRHPLARALRVDKTCLMAMERTLHLFRDPDKLAGLHPLYRMIAASPRELEARAAELAEAVKPQCAGLNVNVVPSKAYLGSGSLPMHELPSFAVALRSGSVKPLEFTRRLRMDEAAVFGRIEDDAVLLDVRTIFPDQIVLVARAVGRAQCAKADQT
ncbi:MAG: L-seryl-tRNA(Sec) selenium transferase [Planctomycetes bacterium]|nr:L-seryl-tRNA(Sec) selenium transferase [Planctomycetota bacterium]